MNTYRVGGAVRDTLLGYPHHETDWVVVGSTPEEMIAEGYTQVGMGAQILRDLGVGKIRLMGMPLRYNSLEGFGLDVVEFIEP